MITLTDMLLLLRQRLLDSRIQENRQAVTELLGTFKQLTRASFESGDRELTAILVDFTDAARDIFMGKPLNGSIPTEATIRTVLSSASQDAPEKKTPEPMLLPQAVPDDHSMEVIRTVPRRNSPLTRVLPLVGHTAPGLPDVLPKIIGVQKTQRLAHLRNVNWLDSQELPLVSTRQLEAHSLLAEELHLFDALRGFVPVWTGDFPIGVETENSSLDIVLEPEDLRSFAQALRHEYGDLEGFRLSWFAQNRIPTLQARFRYNGYWLNLTGQPRPITEMTPYQLMLVEARLLALSEGIAGTEIQQLKQQGKSTAEAFHVYFNLPDEDPVDALLRLIPLDDDRLVERFRTDTDESV